MSGISIPSCIKLDEKQIAALKEWAAGFPLLDDYEDVCCSSSFTFHCYASGLGDVIWVSRGGNEFHVGYDDDGNIVGCN